MAEEKKTVKAEEVEAEAAEKKPAAKKAAAKKPAAKKAADGEKKPAAKKAAAADGEEKPAAAEEKPAAAEEKPAAVEEKPAAKKAAAAKKPAEGEEKPAAKKPAAKKPAAKKEPAASAAAEAAPAAAAKPAKEKPVLPKPTVSYQGTGRRKNAVARVRVFTGTGKIYCNGQYAEDYFGREALKTFVEAPLRAIDGVGKFDVIALLSGGGISGQAGALRLGIARALLASDEELRGDLKHAGLLSRDPRMVERKKYGLKKARKRPQFSKR